MTKDKFIGGRFCNRHVNCIPREAVYRAITCLLDAGAKKATLYLSEKAVITAASRFRPNGGDTRIEVSLKIGRPNYREREFITACKKAGEPFPVKKVQLKWYK